MNKRNRLFSFAFSFIPGAGHMYIGLVKRGISIMGLFFATCMLSTWLKMPVLMFVTPIIWFYSFFDFWNKVKLTTEEFSNVNDRFLWSDIMEKLDSSSFDSKKSTLAGIGTIALGVYIIWRMFAMSILAKILPEAVASWVLAFTTQQLPQLVVAALIIFIGVKLIKNKKDEISAGDDYNG